MWWEDHWPSVLMAAIIVIGLVVLFAMDKAGWWSFEAYLKGQGF